ncbi:hypothetical protein HOLleu_14614 [Holothuria leucospilota]|uniref:Uncharacterized protein n=1 Tax=Holothuria leucospilota TaxID=206669 RepID=A0A9Q1HCM4_HOLLE|nr:hypothetical protein HOLleu_14614 [Holothuria leucospilota]
MKLPVQMLFMVIILHPSISLASELEDEDEVTDPLHYDYDVSSQTMKKRRKDANIIKLEECKKNLEAEKNVRVRISDALEEVTLSKQECLTNVKSLQDEKHQLENILQEEKIVQQELKDTISVCESQNQDLKQNTQSLRSEVVELEKQLAVWKQLCILLFTLALGAVIATAFMYCSKPRVALPEVDVPDQQERAFQQGPPHQENVLHQHPAPQEDAAPLQNVPEEHQYDDDQEGHQVGSHRRRNMVDPSSQVSVNPPVSIIQEMEEIPPLNGERNHGDPLGQVGANPLVGIVQEVEEIPPLNGEGNCGDPSGQVGANSPVGIVQEVEEIPSLNGEGNCGDPPGQVGANPSVGILQEVEEIPPLNGEGNLGDPSGQVGANRHEIYQTATTNCEYESSLAVQPLDD